MKLGIMQPYFFPYLGYYSLIEATDNWIVFDTPDYIRKGWIHRNRVLKKEGEWKYVAVPIKKAPRDTPIHTMQIRPDVGWKNDIIRNLDNYRDSRAPYYDQTVAFLEHAMALDEPRLTPFLVHLLERTCDHVGLTFSHQVFSSMDLQIEPVTHPGEWALRISQAVGASTYINPPGGRDIFDPSQFESAGIQLQFLNSELPPYDQKRNPFMPGLSIIDALMWNSVDEVNRMIRSYHLQP